MSLPIADPTTTFPDSSLEHGDDIDLGFENSYARLPDRFYARVRPTPVADPQLIKLNVALARDLGLDPERLASRKGVEILAGNRVASGSEPLALAYAGHQFGYFVPALGDGRANLLGEVTARNGTLYDIQLKGSGPTPFSRRGDGRAALGPVLREYVVSEAMAAMGVPSTRALAAVTTGEQVQREIPLPGAVLTRVAQSHLRVGTFQYFAAREDDEGLRVLADYAIERHYPEVREADKRYRAFLQGVISRQAQLVAQWMQLGFLHGVMNTDNMSIAGETIDYGPCAFMEAYDPETVFSSIDRGGRYAYQNQPHAAQWNLARLAEAILPLLQQEEGTEAGAISVAEEAVGGFASQFEIARLTGFCRKIGITWAGEKDTRLVEDLLVCMAANATDFTLTFRRLCDAAEGSEGDARVRSLFSEPAAFDAWAVQWRVRLEQEPGTATARAEAMRSVNPAVIPRNHMVEAALQAAMRRADYAPFEELLEAVMRPFDERADGDRYALPGRPEERVTQTFCGT